MIDSANGHALNSIPNANLILGSAVLGQRRTGTKPAAVRPAKTTTSRPTDDSNLSDECPEPDGFFADATQCDKYYACENGVISERLCPDGMVFNDFSPLHEKCDLPFGIDCTGRTELRKSAIYLLINFVNLIFRDTTTDFKLSSEKRIFCAR